MSEHDRPLSGEGSLVSNAPRVQLTPIQKFGVAGLILIVMLGFIWLRQLNKAAPAQKQPDVAMASTTGTFRPAPASDAPPPPTLPMPVANNSMLGLPVQHQMTAEESPIFAFTGVQSSPPIQQASDLPLKADAKLPEIPSGQSNALESKLKPTVLSEAKARLLPHPDMLVTKGTIIPCTLQTAIDTQLAGLVKCVLPNDVRGTTGNVVLLDRGTIVVGEIQAGISRGQNRVFVLWDRAETPDHAIIELSSPGSDELGRSGLPGAVNDHWWQRFGGAIALSVIQGGLQTGTALAANSGQGSGTFFNSFQTNGSNVADTALQATINIAPTLEKNQGDNVSIFIARDLDFSDIYSLRVTGSVNGQ
jgi:type IV secretion system protein VirB10